MSENRKAEGPPITLGTTARTRTRTPPTERTAAGIVPTTTRPGQRPSRRGGRIELPGRIAHGAAIASG
jgi:hypothetical protein